jgi:hypothetical protein
MDPDPDSALALFFSGFQDAKKCFISKLFFLITSVGTFTSIFKGKNLLRSDKTV